MPNRVNVQGLAKLKRDLKTFDAESVKGLNKELRAAGDLVRADAADRLDTYSPKSAAGLRVYLRSGGRVAVEQSIGKTTGLRPDFGKLQMRQALLPALEDKQDEVFAAVNLSLSSLADRI